MTKFRLVLATAATLVLGGLGIGIALNQAGQTHAMSADEWCARIQQLGDPGKLQRFFVALQPDNPIPKAWPAGDEGRLLGDCANGMCTIAPDAAPHCAYTYAYDCGPLRSGWRVCEVAAHPYVARGWKLAAAELDYLRWYGSLRDVVAECRAQFSGADCLAMLQADRQCWLLSDGTVCRYGKQLGTSAACPYAMVKARMPCEVTRGAGSEMIDAERVWTDEEMDEL